MSTLVRRLALYRAQQGATVSDLEQLQASISLPSTIKTVFSLRKFTISSAALVVVWSFYYLGSQSSKREYGYVESTPYHHIRAVYPTNDAPIVDFYKRSETDYLNRRLVAAVSYGTSNAEIQGQDLDGYVLIPAFQNLSLAEATEKPQWVDFTPSGITYSAYAGRSMSLEPAALGYAQDDGEAYWDEKKIVGAYTFNTTYMDVQCGPIEVHPESDFPANVTPGMWTSINKTGSISSSSSLSLPVVFVDLWGRWNESYNKPAPENDPNQTWVPLNINGSTSGSIRVPCNVTNPALRLRAQCSGASCLARAMQYIAPNATEQLPHPLANDTFTAGFFSSLLLSDGTPRNSWGTEIEQEIGFQELFQYLSGESNYNGFDAGFTLMLYLNTYFNLALYAQPGQTGIYHPGPENGFGFLDIDGSPYYPHYALHWGWIAVSYLSGSILVVAAIISFLLRRRTLAPDIFGYVSSLTRDNPHLTVANGGSTLSGIDRARALKNVKIQITDVHGQSGDVGKVGVTVVQDAAEFGPLRKERKYV